ncbi:DNA repair protein RecN [Winogradskyella echinorum]|uniref:DNA repair protein RecN n=1 Tax=Winogradskyella echinorum TaxID=538189 RepID=A0ABR6Y5P2_9FLAO|nr:DNA repair protein RecN [Winogradskyella echinorum]MBC3848025.1 DNA repair protein RecN [Winogradskyella echinorum]MBC5752373.1 DNA repair protein RecN [Winogradskyella echinorum]
MLTSLHIKNYALIDELDVTFNNGLTIITGETGAGKSILLGGLALVLGKRADLSQVKHTNEKCIIEAVFDIANYDLKALFKSLDIDYDVHTIIRREILPSGKSRAFINDTPVNLESLTALSQYLIDIHSQHQTQQLTQDNYQFMVIDALAENRTYLDKFSKELNVFKSLQKSLEKLNTSKAEMIKEYDYNLFLHKELSDINLETINLEDLETQYEELNNVEVIGEKLGNAKAILNAEDLGAINQLNTVKQELSKISSFGKVYETLRERIASVEIELDDILIELDNLEDNLSTDPQELERVNGQLQAINNLFQKHSVLTIEELIEIKNQLQSKIDNTESLDNTIANKEKEIAKLKDSLNQIALKIHKNRTKVIPLFVSKLESILTDLGMPNAKFKIELNQLDYFVLNGKDSLQFLFMANKGSSFNELKKSASGGELSRIMLAIKSILAEYIQLPSIMFDEIDTGVSGEISNKMGEIMKQMSSKMQVFTITHLPQIAAKGNTHFKVFKTDIEDVTHTQLKKLNEDERIVEIAQMLGGVNVTDSALAHAKQLLN